MFSTSLGSDLFDLDFSSLRLRRRTAAGTAAAPEPELEERDEEEGRGDRHEDGTFRMGTPFEFVEQLAARMPNFLIRICIRYQKIYLYYLIVQVLHL